MRRGQRQTSKSPATITRRALRAELDELLRRADINPATVKLSFPKDMDRFHARHPRQFARLDLDHRKIEAARAILSLAPRHRLGILAHEVGHFHCDDTIGRQHSETQTDRCARKATGIAISYDRSWKGQHPTDPTIRGLQVGTDLRAAKRAQVRREVDDVLRRHRRRCRR